MIQNIFLTAYRRLLKRKGSSLIVLAGLVISIATSIIIYLKIKYELSFESFHSEIEKVYRIVRVTSGLDYLNGEMEYRSGVYFALPFAIENEIPEIELIAPVLYVRGAEAQITDSKNGVKKFKESEGVVFLDRDFFRIFDTYGKDYWLSGDMSSALSEPFSVVLDDQIAKKYFGDENPVGKTLIAFDNKIFTIKGVVKRFPENSEFPFKIFISYATLEVFIPNLKSDWGSLGNNQCIIKLKNSDDRSVVEQKIKEIYAQHDLKEEVEARTFKLQAFRKIHFDKRFENFNDRVVSLELIFALAVVGLLLIVIASLNYSTLSLAQAFLNLKDVAVRKTFGGSRIQIILQIFAETFVLVIIALNIGILLSKLLLIKFKSLIDIPRQHISMTEPLTLWFLVILTFTITLISGIYMAKSQSGKNPVDILKGQIRFRSRFKIAFDTAITVFQYSSALTVFISTLFIVKQIHYMTNSDLGFAKEGIILLQSPCNNSQQFETFRQELLKIPEVINLSIGSGSPAETRNWTDIVKLENGVEQRIVTEVKFVDTNYVSTYGLQLICGNVLFKSDTMDNILVNQELLRELRINNKSDGLNTELRLYGSKPCRITGVVKDFHAESFHNLIRPCVMVLKNNFTGRIGIRLKTNDNEYSDSMGNIIDSIEKLWSAKFSANEFNYDFLDQKIEAQYKAESNLRKLFIVFTIITFFVSCIGIFGISYFAIDQRSKEIAIRKINGAKISKILSLLNGKFIILALVSIIIACPIAWFLINKWLQNYSYRTELTWWIFVCGSAIAVLIVLITVSWQSWRAAVKNPVEALRYE